MWPEHDELEVRLMMDLIRHVTGNESIRLTPKFYCCKAMLTASMHLHASFQLLIQEPNHCIHAGMNDCTLIYSGQLNLPCISHGLWFESAVHACLTADDGAGVHVKAWFAPLDENYKGGNLALR